MDMDDATTLAVVVERIDNLSKSLDGFMREMRDSHKDKVNRSEWELRKEYLDDKLGEFEKDITANNRALEDFKKQLADKKAPWWAVAAVVAAGLQFVWNVLGPIITGEPQ